MHDFLNLSENLFLSNSNFVGFWPVLIFQIRLTNSVEDDVLLLIQIVRTSSTVRLPQGPQLHLQDAAYTTKHHDLHATAANNENNTLRRTSSCSDQKEVQKALSLLEVLEMQGHDQWRHQKLNPVSEVAADPKMDTDSLHTWHPGSSTQSNTMNLLAKQEFAFPRAGPLQRRHTLPAMEVLKEVETHQQEAADSNMVDVSSEPAAPGPSQCVHVQVLH